MTDVAFITGGSVTFEQSRKLADYETRKASITFNVGDGKNSAAVLSEALGLAKSHVLAALGLLTNSADNGLPGTAPAAGQSTTTVAPAGEPEKKTRAKKPPAAEAPKTPASNPADFGDVAGTQPQIRTNPENRVDPLEDFADVGAPAVEKITDEALGSAISKKNATFVAAKNPAGTEAIKTLIRGTGVTKYAEIAQEKRSQFLKDLEALKA